MRGGVGEARGVTGASRRKQEVAEQGGGGARGGVAVSVLLAGRKTTGEGGAAVGWAVGGAGPGGLPGERQVVFLSLSISVFYLSILFCVVLV